MTKKLFLYKFPSIFIAFNIEGEVFANAIKQAPYNINKNSDKSDREEFSPLSYVDSDKKKSNFPIKSKSSKLGKEDIRGKPFKKYKEIKKALKSKKVLNKKKDFSSSSNSQSSNNMGTLSTLSSLQDQSFDPTEGNIPLRETVPQRLPSEPREELHIEE